MTAVASPLQVLLARTVHREAQTLLTIPPIRTLHEIFARRLRDMCTAGLDAFAERPLVIDEIEIILADIGRPFQPELTDLGQLTGELEEALRYGQPFAAYLADDLAWIAHLAHLHLVRSELAAD